MPTPPYPPRHRLPRRPAGRHAAALALIAVLAAACARSPERPAPPARAGAPEAAAQTAQAPLPDYPDAAALLPVRMPPTSTAEVMLDPASLSVGDDGEVRVTYVVVSRTGVRSVFYEGFRCDERVYRTYAWGAGDGPFHASSELAWKPIPWTSVNNFRGDLRSYYLCGDFSAPRHRDEILRYVRQVELYYD